MSTSTPNSQAYSVAAKRALAWFRTERPEHWEQLHGDARVAVGLPRATQRRNRYASAASTSPSENGDV